MERRLNKKMNEYIISFKNDICTKIKMNGLDNNIEMDILNFIYNYEKFEFTKEDFMKRKRAVNTVPIFERCCAKRANGEQCTRRKNDNSLYCGTHSKGTPHGVMDDEIDNTTTTKKVEVTTVEIKGIYYYVDNNSNVYNTEDIVSGKNNPRVIAKYQRDGDDYSIPQIFN